MARHAGVVALAFVLGACPTPVLAAGHMSAGAGHHHRRSFVHPFVLFDPFFFPVPYYAPYPYRPYDYPPGDYPTELGWGTDEPLPSYAPVQEEGDDGRSYGLVQLQGVPDDSAVDLDGRFWLVAHHLEERWLALSAGVHALVVRAPGRDPIPLHVDVVAGTTRVLRFDARG